MTPSLLKDLRALVERHRREPAPNLLLVELSAILARHEPDPEMVARERRKLAARIVDAIEREMNDRRGLHWSSLDDGIRQRLKTSLRALVVEHIDRAELEKAE